MSLLGLVFVFIRFFFLLLACDPVYVVYLDKVKILTAQMWTHFYCVSSSRKNLLLIY